jgi:hypothetical protein
VLIAGLPLALVLLTVNTGAAGFSVIMLIGVYLTFGARALERTLRLRSARNAKVLVQVVGPVLVSHYANDKTAHYRMRLEDDAVLSIDAETHGRLARLGQMRMGEDRSVFWDERSRSEHLIGEHEVPSVTVTYEPKAPVLFEILNVFSEPVYRDPDIGPNTIPHDEPRV